MDSEIIYEIFEVILVFTLFLVIAGAILLISNPALLTTTTMGNEISYLSVIKNDNIETQIEIEKDYTLEVSDNNKFGFSKKGVNTDFPGGYFLGENQLKQDKNLIILT